MNRELAGIIQGEKGSPSELQRLVHQHLGGYFSGFASAGFKHPHHDLHIVLPKAVQPERFGRRIDLSICSDFLVAVFCGPFGNLGVKTFSISNNWRQHKKVAAFF